MRNFCIQMVNRAREQQELAELSETIFGLYSQGRRMNRRIAARHGLTAPQLSAMSMLVHAGSASLGELGERMHTGASTLTGIVDRLERDGLAARERSAEDRRVWRVALTARGRTLATHLEAMPGGVVREALASLTVTERRE